MYKKWIMLFLVFFWNAVSGENTGQVSLSRVTPAGGVGHTMVICIEEDDQGFIWFGTNNGLFSYNSREIQRYYHDPSDSTSLPTNRINHIFRDFTGKLWITTEMGLCSYDTKKNHFIRYPLRDEQGNKTGDDITGFVQTADSVFWIADEKGFGRLDITNQSVSYYSEKNKPLKSRIIARDDQGRLWAFLEDGSIGYKDNQKDTLTWFSKDNGYPVHSVYFHNGDLWIAYETEGLVCLDHNGKVKREYNQKNGFINNQIRAVVADENHRIWVATYAGIVILDDYQVSGVIREDQYPELPNHSIWSLYRDSRKNIWIGTWLGGLCFHSRYNKSFMHYSTQRSLSYNVVSCFTPVPGKPEIIVGTEDGVLNYFHTGTGQFTHVPLTSGEITVQNIKSLVYDKNETLWIGTYDYGVFYQKKGQKDFSRLVPPFETGFQVYDMCPVENGIWVSDYPNGVYFYDFFEKSFRRYQHDPLDIHTISHNSVNMILEDKKGNMWFATRNGLNLLKKGSDQFIHFFHQEKNSKSISGNMIYHLYEDNDGFIWLSTNVQGADKFNPVTETAEHITSEAGLPGNEVFSILQDDKNNFWFTTNMGICRLDQTSGQIRVFENANGIRDNNFNPKAALSFNGQLYFGGTNGFVRFDPEKISENPIAPNAVITRLFIHNQEIFPDDIDNRILDDVIGKTKKMKLSYKQNSIGFEFVSDNFINPENNRFRYRLSGFDDQWTETDYSGKATFIKVPPGKYVFEVLAANNDGLWGEIPAQISVQIIPPFWKTWYALIFYTMGVVMIVLYFRQQIINKQKLKNEIELEKINRENEKYLHRMKLQFFTNISHEFRTPLTLIRGPVERLLAAENEDEKIRKQLFFVRNNTDRLLRLINQLLDFRKMESGSMDIRPVNADIIDFCKQIFACFEEHARHRSFTYTFESNVPALYVDFDPEKIDKVLFNILSNAFKYSNDGGNITLKINSGENSDPANLLDVFVIGDQISGEYVEIRVNDSGRGIPAENLSRIFDRFYQVEPVNSQGTGIGLSLSKSYVLLHKGQFIVLTSVNRGSSFAVRLPFRQSGVLTEHHGVINIPEKSTENSSLYTGEIQANNKVNLFPEDAHVLIVEDNPELLDYLDDVLHEQYRTVKAVNGKEALDKAEVVFPDIIISDVLMPELDGFALCEKIKTDIRTSHIPVILLTALDTVKDRITGLHSGADAYIPKPFDDNLLIAQVSNLLMNRKILRETFSGGDRTSWEEKFRGLDLDKKLLSHAIRLVEENMDKTDFSVEQLAKGLNLSRAHLHRKLKALTNQSATEFIRYIRLRKAVKLLQEGKCKVNEAGFAVGFNSHHYFTKSFRRQFGKSPSEYMKEYNGG